MTDPKVKPEDNTGTDKNEYYDILSTEDCFTFDDSDDKLTRYNEETQEIKKIISR